MGIGELGNSGNRFLALKLSTIAKILLLLLFNLIYKTCNGSPSAKADFQEAVAKYKKNEKLTLNKHIYPPHTHLPPGSHHPPSQNPNEA